MRLASAKLQFAGTSTSPAPLVAPVTPAAGPGPSAARQAPPPEAASPLDETLRRVDTLRHQLTTRADQTRAACAECDLDLPDEIPAGIEYLPPSFPLSYSSREKKRKEKKIKGNKRK